MTVGSAMGAAALRVSGGRPSSFFGSTEQLEVEFCDLVNEVAEDVARYQDWQGLIGIHTLNGDGGETEFPLPADYDRMLIAADVQDPGSWAWGYSYYADVNQFIRDQERGPLLTPGGWIILQDKMQFVPAPAGRATFTYISKNWAVDGETGARKAEFTKDTDEFVLPERLLTLGLVWRWRENKRLDAEGDQEAFVKALDEYASRDRGARIIRRGGGGACGWGGWTRASIGGW